MAPTRCLEFSFGVDTNVDMPNSLTRNVGLKVGPLLLETLFKHYFADKKKSNAKNSNEKVDGRSELRQNELLYDEVFTIVKVCYARC